MAHHPRPRTSGRLAKTDAKEVTNSDKNIKKKEKEVAADEVTDQANVVDSHSTVPGATFLAVREIGSITIFKMPLRQFT